MKPSTTLVKFFVTRRVPVALCNRNFSSQSPSVGVGGSATPESSPATSLPLSSYPSAENPENNEVSNAEADGQRGTISKAMNAYLKRARDHQTFMDKQEKEFVFGRRHLANMMGKDPENFTQRDINEAIRYLFPSGLYEPRARPMMKPPQEIYPKQKAAQFDLSGRPHHPFFYTAKPNFYYLLHEMVSKLQTLAKLGSSRTASDFDNNDSLLAGSTWLSKEDLEQRLMEKLTDEMYNEWLSCMERFAGHPNLQKELEYIQSYRKPLIKQATADQLPPVTLEPDGRKSVHVPLCMKKTARADVLLTVPGTGIFKINGKGLEYFELIQNREAVIAPLQLVDWLGKCDIEANCEGGTLAVEHQEAPGETSRAGAVRWGIATAIAALGCEVEKLRLAGFLVRDHRLKERTKVGRTGARAKWTWKKR